MTFPDQKFTAIGDYAGAYFEKLKAAAASVPKSGQKSPIVTPEMR